MLGFLRLAEPSMFGIFGTNDNYTSNENTG